MSESMMVEGPERIAENTAIPRATPIEISSAGRGGFFAPRTEAIIALVIGFVVFAGALLVLTHRTDVRR